MSYCTVYPGYVGNYTYAKVDWGSGSIDPIDAVEERDLPDGMDAVEDPESPPTLEGISNSGAPGTFIETIEKTTTWDTLDLTIETAPDLHIAADTSETATDPSTEYTGSVTVPNETAEEFTDTYTIKESVSIPVPPNVSLGGYAGEIPNFEVAVPDTLLDWAYTEYTSAFLDTLIVQSDALLTGSLDTSDAVLRDNRIWDSQPYFLLSRGIGGVARTSESVLHKKNIDRLVVILEADYGENDKHTYVQTRQAIENLKRGMYDAQKGGEFGYAKAWAENRFENYFNLLESYNQLLIEYRLNSIAFQEKIQLEKDKLADSLKEIQAYSKGGQLDAGRMNYYKAQVNIVNSTIKSYEISMSVSEAIANITLMSAEMDRLNTESFVLKSRALAQAADNDAYFSETDTMKLDLIDADLAYTKTSLEKSAAQLERTIGMIEEATGENEFESDKSIANINAQIETLKASSWVEIARERLSADHLRTLEEKAGITRKTATIENRAQHLKDELDVKVALLNDSVIKDSSLAELEDGAWAEAATRGIEKVGKAEASASDMLSRAELIQSLLHMIKSEEEE